MQQAKSETPKTQTKDLSLSGEFEFRQSIAAETLSKRKRRRDAAKFVQRRQRALQLESHWREHNKLTAEQEKVKQQQRAEDLENWVSDSQKICRQQVLI